MYALRDFDCSKVQTIHTSFVATKNEKKERSRKRTNLNVTLKFQVHDLDHLFASETMIRNDRRVERAHISIVVFHPISTLRCGIANERIIVACIGHPAVHDYSHQVVLVIIWLPTDFLAFDFYSALLLRQSFARVRVRVQLKGELKVVVDLRAIKTNVTSLEMTRINLPPSYFEFPVVVIVEFEPLQVENEVVGQHVEARSLQCINFGIALCTHILVLSVQHVPYVDQLLLNERTQPTKTTQRTFHV